MHKHLQYGQKKVGDGEMHESSGSSRTLTCTRPVDAVVLEFSRRGQNTGALKLDGSSGFMMVHNLHTRTASSRTARVRITLSRALSPRRKAQRLLLLH